jgi:aryl-alcohol dehydrogenase-like predicted oxidoreductase
METTTLGRTGLRVTVAGPGCGGHSRLGLPSLGPDHAAGIVRAACDAGVNFFDTATAYGTRAAVGQGLRGVKREDYVLSTKFPYKNKTPRDLLKATSPPSRAPPCRGVSWKNPPPCSGPWTA